MNLAFVIQRYGTEVSGGAELHCRWIAERLAARHHVEVFTTCALDYILWKNHYSEGQTEVNGITVNRYPVERERDLDAFSATSQRVFSQEHGREDELRWIEENGPYAPGLVEAVREAEPRFDFIFFFCYRYYTSYHGVTAVPQKAILVPTAEEDEAAFIPIFGELFGMPRAIVHNSVEELELIQRVSNGGAAPGDVVGVGIEIPDPIPPADAFRRKYNIDGPFLLYVGRIDWNKGCDTLFSHFISHSRIRYRYVKLVLIGTPVLQIPHHADILHLGRLGDAEKFQALDACTALVVPSRYESLSMAVLEAWGRDKPVLVNGGCPVLKGQVMRADGGLIYESFEEFSHAMDLILDRPDIATALGRQGNAYYKANYTWERVEHKYEELLRRLSG